MRLTVLGPRGSMAVSLRGRELFGTATSCYMVQAGADCVFLDAGTGLLDAPAELPEPPLILLSHLHLDHLLGLGMYRRLILAGTKTRILLPARTDREAEEFISQLYSPPLWPLRLTDYRGDVSIGALRLPMRYGSLYIEGIAGNHPGGSVILRLSNGAKSLVYATDYEHEEPSFSRLAEFARDTDLLIYDGQYTEEEYQIRKGFGHSTPEKGVELMELCGAKRLLLTHHDPLSKDLMLLEREQTINRADVRFAREGQVIEL